MEVRSFENCSQLRFSPWGDVSGSRPSRGRGNLFVTKQRDATGCIMIYTADDVKMLSKCAWMEARGEGIFGCYAVMHAVCNRVNSPGFPKTLYRVIFQKNAFSWTRKSDLQYGKEPPLDDEVYMACLEDAPYVLDGDSDPVRGARYYANLDTISNGGWFERNISGSDYLGLPGHEFVVKFGKHSFYL